MTVRELIAAKNPTPIHMQLTAPKRSRGRLGNKLLLLVAEVGLLGVLVSTLLILVLQQQQFLDNAHTTSKRLSHVAEAGLMHAMLENNWEMIDQVVQVMIDKESIERIRLLDNQGTVLSSSTPAEVGQTINSSEAVCQSCHTDSAPLDVRTTITMMEKDHEHLVSASLLHNEIDCQACHDPQIQVLGLLTIETSTAQLRQQMVASSSRIVLSASITYLVLAILMTWALRRLVTQPLDGLRMESAAIAAGNLEHPMPIAGQDEVGDLARSFDAMRQELKNARAATERQKQKLWLLFQLGTQITSSLELEQILDAVAASACQLPEADIGIVGLWDERNGAIVVKAVAGAHTNMLATAHMPLGTGWPSDDSDWNTPAVAKEWEPALLFAQDPAVVKAEGIISILGIPLRRGQQLLGMMAIMTRQHRHFSAEDAQFLTHLAYPVTIAIENAQLYEQLHQLVALEERDRLAREMHDRLAQALGYVNLKASIVGEMLANGQSAQAQNGLIELKEVAGNTYTDVREAIFNLRTTIGSGLGFLPALRDYLAEYRTHYGTTVQLHVDEPDVLLFSPEAAIQLLRVIQEALTNVRKHAQASQVWISFEQDGDHLRIVINDDGHGFAPDALLHNGDHGYGLEIMQERLASVGGTLTLDSGPDIGTRVVIYIPLDGKE